LGIIQGGIEFRETPIETLEREVVEELGYHFYQSCHFPPEKFIWLFEDQMQTKISGTLLTEEGKEIKPIAKYYIIFAAILRTDQFPHVNPDDSNFKGTTVKLHKCKWTNYQEARELVKTNQNPKKREIAERILEKLKEKNFIE
jgi:8-oxo-dGTP pyrophosphatase MutT (NUDIX family)